MNNLSKFEIGIFIAVLSGAVWIGALTTKVEFLQEDYGAIKEEKEKTINEIQSQKEIVLAEIEQRLKLVQEATNEPKIKAFESQLVQLETRITQVQQTVKTFQIAELQTQIAGVEGKLNQLNQTLSSLKTKMGKVSQIQSSDKGVFRHPLKIGGYGPEMVTIPSGRLQMGSNHNSDEQIHWVSIKTFAMSRYEITFDEYDAFAKATGKTKPSDGGWGRGNRPVINVSWHDAVAYTKWLSEQTGQEYRLPSEAEWEYAARGGTETKYWWGNEASHEYANYGTDDCCDGLAKGKDRWKYTAPVGSFDQNPFGLYDTVGNLWEYCADNWHKNYEGAPTDGTVWKGGNKSYRVLRGGSWFDYPVDCRTAVRNWDTSDNRNQIIGFRVAARL